MEATEYRVVRQREGLGLHTCISFGPREISKGIRNSWTGEAPLQWRLWGRLSRSDGGSAWGSAGSTAAAVVEVEPSQWRKTLSAPRLTKNSPVTDLSSEHPVTKRQRTSPWRQERTHRTCTGWSETPFFPLSWGHKSPWVYNFESLVKAKRPFVLPEKCSHALNFAYNFKVHEPWTLT